MGKILTRRMQGTTVIFEPLNDSGFRRSTEGLVDSTCVQESYMSFSYLPRSLVSLQKQGPIDRPWLKHLEHGPRGHDGILGSPGAHRIPA